MEWKRTIGLMMAMMTALLLPGRTLGQESPKPCPRYQAPGQFDNAPAVWGTTDSGVIVDGFVDLIGAGNKVFDVLHGSDLSIYNEVTHEKMAACGGKFSFVRMDNGFDTHYRALQKAGIKPVPYVYFKIPTELRRAHKYVDSGDGSQQLEQILSKFELIAEKAASTTLNQLEQSQLALQSIEIAGMRGKLIAVDIEEKLLDEKQSQREHRVAYGRGYGRALCRWTTLVKKRHTDLTVILYTMPAVYGDYLRYALPADHACIKGLPVWIAHTTADGGDSIYSSSRRAASIFSDESAQRLCLLSTGNRCVIHQYSHRATFASAKGFNPKKPQGIDINRWFPSIAINTEAGTDWVRRDDLPPPITFHPK
ncbi:hypothetical protein H5407_13150 [Mitsuaria sp. WAJ17]|uniref:hypothetical protein n=1 Tax=Mitsuaria sp. WAJ17 TaxID=2761452 RepID=UPI00160103A4|nr:hypothetical protein [Mitsuaria sp. WAJ17]MBB2486164.1 hypothetical protein [Mitsuaria sp. WAJ17]